MRGGAALVLCALAVWLPSLQPAAAQFRSTYGSSGQPVVTGQSGSSVGRGSSEGGSSGSSQGKGSSTASGSGDPILTGFDGRTFEFLGRVGGMYSLLSEESHQLSTRLKFAHMWDHNGTYMEAFSLRHQEHNITVELGTGDDLAVAVDGAALAMPAGHTEAEHLFPLTQGELQLHWQLHKPQYGNAVEMTSGLLRLLVWVTPAGTRDEGGVEQPAYLNFDLGLLAPPPAGRMEGVLGHTYGEAAGAHPDDWAFHHDAAEFEMADFTDAAHPRCLFHAADSASQQQQSRRLLRAGAARVSSSAAAAGGFPLRASGRGSAAPGGTHKGGRAGSSPAGRLHASARGARTA